MSDSAPGAGEPLLSAGQARRCCYELTGHKPSPSTYWRWILGGRLTATRVGGRLFTTESAIRAMLAADEQRNRGSAGARGAAAAARLSAALKANARREATS